MDQDVLNDEYEEEGEDMGEDPMESQMSVFDVDWVKGLENEMSKM